MRSLITAVLLPSRYRIRIGPLEDRRRLYSMSKFSRRFPDAFRRTCRRRIAQTPVSSSSTSYFIKVTEEKTPATYQTPKGFSSASEALRQKN